MARKDFDAYYNKIAKQYHELNNVVEELSEQLSKNLVEPERVDNAKITLKPIATSFQTVSYIKYLLDKPTRKTKHKKYDTNNKLLTIAGNNNGETILKNNQEILRNIKL